MKVETLTPVVAAAPGARAVWRVRIENDEAGPLGYRFRVIGFDPDHVLAPPPTPPLAPGEADEVGLELVVPEGYAAGHHSIAVEVIPDRAGSASVIAAVTVTVGRIDEVALAVVPSTIRARRRASFRLDIDNRSTAPVDLDLAGEGPGLDVRLRPGSLVLQPGERVRTKGRVKAPRLFTGEPRQHSMIVTARSRSAPSYAPATFHQRPLFPNGLRSMLAVLLVVAIWAGALGAGYLWWDSRHDTEQQAGPQLVDTDGDGVVETPADQLVDTDGDGVPDTLAAVVAEEVAAGAEQTPPQPGGSDRPTRTVLGGTVQSGDSGEPEGVAVTLTPMDLGSATTPSGPVGFANPAAADDGDGPGKVWPARFGLYEPLSRSDIRRTQSVPSSTITDGQGAWLFSDVAVGRPYEVSFSRPGYDTQAFVVTPTGDGKPIELGVELVPARGSVSGRVVGSGGGLGNVELELTDGDLTFQSASASGAGAGQFTFTGVSTPGTYALRANLPGFGTEVVQVTLEPGEQLTGITIGMRTGVGSISGRVTEDGEPLGGVTLTASSGDATVETTSLTEGDTGSYTVPQLDIPGRYTITASLEGYLTQTRLVNLNGNVTGVNFDFRKTTGVITGLVESSNGGGLPGANVRVSRDELAFDTATASSGDPGSFTVRDLPPGTYLIEFSRYDHAPQSQVVTVEAGQVVDLGRIVLEFQPRPPIAQNGSLEVRVVDSLGDPLNGATVRVRRLSDGTVVAEQSDTPPEDQASFVFQPIDIGTYQIEVTKPNATPGQPSLYRPSTRRTTVGLASTLEVVTLFKLGQASGHLVDSWNGAELVDYDVQIIRINPDNSETIVQSIPVTSATPPKVFPPNTVAQIRFETAEASLTSGNYLVRVINPPPGYRVVPDQVLQAGQPPMRFVISPTNDIPIDLGDIEADRFPEVAGTVLAPQLAATGGTITFLPIETANLRVTLTCPGTDGVPGSVTLDAPRPTVPPGQPDSGLEDKGGGGALDSYFFHRVTLESNDLSGECTLDVTADGYEPAQIPLVVSPGDGSSDPLVFANVAMIRPDAVGGTAFWIDRGAPAPGRVAATGVSVRTQGTVIVRFAPGTTERTDPGSEPRDVPATAPLTTTTGSSGGWEFLDPRQVFGSTNYVFSGPGRFTDRIITIRLSQSPRTVTAADGSTLPIDASQPAIAVQLDALGALITANVEIATIKGSTDFPTTVDLGGFTATLSGGDTGTATLTPVGPNTGNLQQARATFSTNDPGTQTVTIESTAAEDGRPLFERVSAQAPPFPQLPGTPATSPATVRFVERGALDLRVLDVNGAPIPGARVNITGPAFSLGVTTGVPLANVVRGLPVGPATGATAQYGVALDTTQNPTLDLSTADLRVFNEVNVQQCGARPPLPPLPPCSSFTMEQGGQPRAEIRVSRRGSITGQVFGDDGSTTPVDLIRDPLLRVVAIRVAAINPTTGACTAIPPGTPGEEVTATPVDTGGPDTEVDSFRFSGLPGLYRMEFRHPAYETSAATGPAGDGAACPGLIFAEPVYRMQNDVDRVLADPFFTLDVLPSATSVTVLNDDLTTGHADPDVGTALAGASVTITKLGDPTGTPVQTGPLGEPALFTLDPASYTVVVSKTSAVGEVEYFEVEFSMSVPAGGRPVTVRVPLPRIGGSITGTVIAVNSERNVLLDRVAVPARVTVTDAYNPPDPAATGATVGTVANPAPATPVTATNAADGLSGTYTIDPAASGVHTLSFQALAPLPLTTPDPAYLPSDPVPIPVTVLGLILQPASDAVFVAADRDVRVTVRTTENRSSPEGAMVRLVDPDDPAAGIPRQVGGCTAIGAVRTCTVTFEDVPPEQASYAVEVTKPRYRTQTATFTVAPGDPATPVDVPPVTIAGEVAHVSGFAEALDAATGPTEPLPADGTVELFLVGGAEPVDSGHDATGFYEFDILARGTYEVVASAPGYAERRVRFVVDRTPAADLDLGEEATLDTIVVPLLATFQITVSPEAARAGSTIATAVTGTATPPPDPESTATGFNVVVDPGASYRFTISSPNGFVPVQVPLAPQQPGIGATVPLTAPMQERTITGTITGASSGISVRLTPATTPAPTVTVTGSSYTITRVPNGTWTVEAAALRAGRGVSAAQTVESATLNLTAVGVTLSPRPVTVPFTVSPATAAVALTGRVDETDPTTGASRSFSRRENVFPVTWTATADGFVTQSSTIDLPATVADPFATTLALPNTPITLIRPVMSATVLAPGAGGTAVTDATVVMCPGLDTDPCTATTTGAVTLTYVTARSQYEGTPTASGDWRITATHAIHDPAPLTPFDVSVAGVITPTPPATLTLTVRPSPSP